VAVVVPSASASAALEPPSAELDAGAGGDAGDAGDEELSSADASLTPPVWKGCPPEMVRVGKTCIDRWEASLVDRRTKEPLSPYYPPQPKLCTTLERRWQTERATLGGPAAQAMPVPALSELQHGHFEPMAVSKPGVTPAGYLSGVVAEKACEAAGKRLCRVSEWVKACEGEAHRQFPYGEKYEPARCNIFRSHHPAAVLHDNPSIGHLDPRLNLVKEGNDPLLRPTGATKSCASVWGPDALYDMNGNIDEWVLDDTEPPAEGEETLRYKFVGGFFSRSKKDGCLSGVRNHGKTYFDYSTGVRCCREVVR
jgi:formylglycine-generating enzyme